MIELCLLNSSYPYTIFNEVAQMHISEIQQGTLPLLGENFLSRLYFELAKAPKTGLWVAIENEMVIGFIAGCASTRESYLSVIRSAVIPLSLLAMSSLVKPWVICKISALLAYPLHSTSISELPYPEYQKPEAELLAIAIHRRARRRGIGKMLVAAFEEGLVSWGIKGNYCVATNLVEEKSNLFYQNIGFEPCYQQRHNNLILQVYQKRIESKLT
jgi:ribosomal protein S18 acetylase RimI-like enzyme